MEAATTPPEDRSLKIMDGATNTAGQDARGRSLDIDRAKGLGIALVVWGHIPSTATPGLPTWFYITVSVIYAFHMPLFMYLSGFVFFMSNSQERFWKAPAGQIAKRFDRLIIPCVALGFLVVTAKYVVQQFGAVDDHVDSISSGIMKIATNAPGNPSLSVWYLIVLFLYTIFAPVLWRLGRRTLAVAFLFAVIGWILPLPDAYYLDRIGTYFIFFCVGALFAVHRDSVLAALARWWIPAMLVFGVACYVMLGSPLALLVCGLASIPALHGLFLQRFWDNDQLFLTLGRNSMAIYLMNTVAIGLVKLIYLRFIPYYDLYFIIFLSTLFLSGIIGPILVRRFICAVPRLRFFNRYLA